MRTEKTVAIRRELWYVFVLPKMGRRMNNNMTAWTIRSLERS